MDTVYDDNRKYRIYIVAQSLLDGKLNTTNTQFIYTLLGNTQAAKRARLLTKAVDPKEHALWTLADLYTYLVEYLYQVYDQNEHSSFPRAKRHRHLRLWRT